MEQTDSIAADWEAVTRPYSLVIEQSQNAGAVALCEAMLFALDEALTNAQACVMHQAGLMNDLASGFSADAAARAQSLALAVAGLGCYWHAACAQARALDAAYAFGNAEKMAADSLSVLRRYGVSL